MSDEVILEVLKAWENWPRATAELYRELGLSKMQLVILLKKGKKLVKNGAIIDADFKEIQVAAPLGNDPLLAGSSLTMSWDNGRLISFPNVDLLVDFVKKVA